MKRKFLWVFLSGLMVLILVVWSCGGTTNVDSEQEEEEEEEEEEDSYLVQLMKLSPEGSTQLLYVDTELMTNDPDFRFIYEDIIGSELVLGLELQDAGINISEIDALGYIEDVLVFIGDFNLEDVRDALMNEDFIEDEYQGVEIWTNDFDDTIAFLADMIISGYTDKVEACIRVYKNMDAPLYDNEDMKSVIEKLPIAPWYLLFNWVVMDGHESGNMYGGIYVSNEYDDDEILNISGWFKFDSETSAENNMYDVTDYMGYMLGAINVEAELNGQFIEVTGEIPVE